MAVFAAAAWAASLHPAGAQSPVGFTEIESVVPARGSVGTPVRIILRPSDELAKYLAEQGTVDVFFDDTGAKVRGLDDISITTEVPKSISVRPLIRVIAGELDLVTDVFRVLPGIVAVEPPVATPGSRVTLIPDVSLSGSEKPRVLLFSQQLELAELGSRSLVAILPDAVATGATELTLEIDGVRGQPFFGLTVEAEPPGLWARTPPVLQAVASLLGALILLLALQAAWAMVRDFREDFREGRKGREPPPRRPGPVPAELEYDGPPIPEVPKDLARAVAERTCVLFAGGGLSAAAGFPTWKTGLDPLVEKARATLRSKPGDAESDRDRILDSLQGASAFEALDLLQARLGEEFVYSFVEETYGGDVTRLPKLASTVSTLPFAGVITTNWDDVVTKCFRSRGRPWLPSEWEQLTSVVRKNEFFLIQLHGAATSRDSLVLTPADYRRVLEQNEPFKRFLRSTYASRTFLFLGSSRASIEQFLTELFLEETGQTHFALVPFEPGFDRHRQVFESKFRVRLLGYQPTNDHLEVMEFVDDLKRRVAEMEKKLPDAREEASPWLERVVLENIGPFEKLDLRLEPTWNVLLGDNGCGKSTVLRAIALGLCGPDERVGPLAGKLLRYGRKRGTVALTISGETYTTELVRDPSSGRIRVESPQRYTPLERGQWLALGFPALRGISTKNPSESSSEIESRAPATDDLLPLLSGKIDTRMNDFKQWVFNAYIRDSSGGGEELKQIFSFLENVTPGLKLAFAGFDEATMQMMVETDDGKVPLELLSQGTTSIIAVVGTLLHRLAAVYRERPETAPRPALVVVDEVAAHMHPAWQYSLAGLVRRSFEDLQIVAATHSPLLLGSIEEGVIFRLKRHPGGIDVTPTEKPLYGWLAEDIYEFMGVEDTRAEGFRVRLNTFKQLDEMRIKGTASAQQLEQLEALRQELRRLPGEDPVSLTMELDNLAALLDEEEPRRPAPGEES